MSEFSADWLQLREAADTLARGRHQLATLLERPVEIRSEAVDHRPRRFTEILDLGAGTGANLRYLAPRLGPGQRWRCIDQDPALLAQLPGCTADWADRQGYQIELEAHKLRLSGRDWSATACPEQGDLAAAQGSLAPRLDLPSGGLVTASALLDLVSADWLGRLIHRAYRHDCALLFALSYDGRVALTPARPEDGAIIALVNQHQGGDKGFGPALGPRAPDHAETLLAAAGYWYQGADSDWQLGPDQPGLQRALIDGWLEAAARIAPQASAKLQQWQQARRLAIETGGLQITVGHRDLIALKPKPWHLDG